MMLLGNWFVHEARFDTLLHPYRVRADRIMVGMNAFLLLICLLLVPLYDTLYAVLLVGLPTFLLAALLAFLHPGELITRLYMGAAFMVFTGLIIHQNAGDIEAHFSAFGLIGVLLYYRDWRTILMATAVIYLHHLVLGYAQTLGLAVYVFDSNEYWLLFWVHVAYFLPFVLMMAYLSIWLRREGYEDQHVMAIAQDIMQGNLVADRHLAADQKQAPLIHSVLMMKNRLLDLLRVMPVPAAVIRLDNETLVNINEAWERKMGTLPIGAKVQDSLICSIPGTWARLLEALHASPDKLLDKQEVSLRYPDGSEAICEVSVILHEESHPVMAILTLEDITQRKHNEQTMHRLAFYDMLTELPNRTHLAHHLEDALMYWRENGIGFAVMTMDLDGFKPINDAHGHDVGDKVLQIIGKRLCHIKRERDLIARLGGDEFVVVLNHCEDQAQAYSMAERLITSISAPMQLEANGLGKITLEVGVSIGIAHIANGAESAEELLKQADVALYRAKQSGKCQAVLFSNKGW
jgi:diguanylate cyclase (GGDEF)-like protein